MAERKDSFILPQEGTRKGESLGEVTEVSGTTVTSRICPVSYSGEGRVSPFSATCSVTLVRLEESKEGKEKFDTKGVGKLRKEGKEKSGSKPDKKVEEEGLSDGTVVSMDTAASDGPTSSASNRQSRSKKRIAREALKLSSDSESCASSIVSEPKLKGTAKRGRGRPSTSGHCSVLTTTNVAGNANRSDSELELEADVIQAVREFATIPADSLELKVKSGVQVIVDIAQKSKHLKGTFVGALKKAAFQIEQAVVALSARTCNDEVEMLRSENDVLRKKVDSLCAEMMQIRTELEKVRVERVPALVTQQSGGKEDELRSTLMRDIGFMMDAKLAGLEDRLLPEKRLRPPLKASSSSLAPEASGCKKPVEGKNLNRKASKKASGIAASPKSDSTGNSVPPPRGPERSQEGWNTVVRKGKKKATNQVSKITPAGKSPTSLVDSTRPHGKVKPKKARNEKPKLRAPRSAAVVLTLPSEAAEQGITYDKVLLKAKESVDLAQLGINGLNFRLAVTGARVLEIPGKESGKKADRLAGRLREVLPEVVKVARPTKCTDLRISGLDDSVEAKDIATAIAEAGQCSQESIKVGPIRVGLFGVGSVLVQCPVVAAKALIARGRLLVGWSSARVQALEPRPLKCFRCFEIGHTGRQCRSQVDRSRNCFRCGQEGHFAATCTGDLQCPLCKEAGRSSNHAPGGRKCARPKKGKRVAIRAPAAPNHQPREPLQEDAMLTG